MRVNVNHPTFIQFLDSVSTTILSNINVETYFSLTQDKKNRIQYMVYKLMKNCLKVRAVLTDNEFKNFIGVLCKKNELSENYEFAAILKDISNNFEHVVEKTKPIKRKPRKIKTDIPDNG